MRNISAGIGGQVGHLMVNGPAGDALCWDAIDWRFHEDNVRRLRQHLAPGATGDPPDTPTILALACLARAAGDMTPPDRAGNPAGMQPTTAPDGRHLHGLLAEPAPLRCPTQSGR